GVVSDADIMENGYASAPLSPLEFITADPSRVVGMIWTVTSLYFHSIFFEREWLAPLALGWPGAVVALLRGWDPWAAKLVLVGAAADFVFYGLTWSSWQDRFMLPTVFLLLPFVVDGLLRGIRFVRDRAAAGRVPPAIVARGPAALLSVAVVAVMVA